MSLQRAALRQLERPFARCTQTSTRARHLSPTPCRTLTSRPTCRSSPQPSPRGYATAIPASDLEFGQPVYETHPHILKPGEITPGITAQEYHDRRARLAESLPGGAIAILPAAELKYRSGAVFYPYRQESNFLYLTGFLEPDAVAVLAKTGPLPSDFTFHLFCRPKDPAAEQWSGPWSGLRAALDPHHPLTPKLRLLLQSSPLRDLRPLVHAHRAIKSPAEITTMRHAGRISGRALTAAMSLPWPTEHALHAHLTHAFSQHGLSGPAYVPVIAGGRRGLNIHYVQNTAALSPPDTVLVDAGGEYGHYITDITRTWPLSGRFSPAQRDLYEVVLSAQRAGVARCRADADVSLDDIQRMTEGLLREGLRGLGFELGRDGLARLFPHHVGHYVGLDVHDVPGYSRGEVLREGHCVTVEPGVYVPDEERWPVHFRGLAVRIEDSVCVGGDAPTVLTTEAVKEVVDIEALRA
ncbi:peptidase M24, structural domain-containing protein [Schizothecium vesticola]|uniref:Xaa-Pro aminopeptidase n=1 Tax=Schizothecium vesticola TaxID=314040 RepID=A0AA40EPK4_9PEZI|nr:peptidase M24, structural domain-containing protein [Schizothecium vesticola]